MFSIVINLYSSIMEIKKGDKVVIYEDTIKVVFGIHKNGNILIKNKGTLCQVPLNKCRKW